MCATCGCSTSSLATFGGGVTYRRVEGKTEKPDRMVDINERVLAKNDLHAQRNREWLRAADVVAFNLLSSPGSGKTTLLERTLRDVGAEHAFRVIEGDQETALDAERIRATGFEAIQINTGSGCHLEAEMVGRALASLAPPAGAVVMIENVGNLVCPALFDLGENAKVVLASVTEGDDKPLKYPHMFRAATLVLLNKVDLLPYVPFAIERFVEHVHRLNASATVLAVSALTGEGMPFWYGWLRERARKVGAAQAVAA